MKATDIMNQFTACDRVLSVLELLNHIMHYVRDDCDWTGRGKSVFDTLSTPSLVCKSWNFATTPHLFKKLSIDPFKSRPMVEEDGSLVIRGLNMVTCPRLLNTVRALWLETRFTSYTEEERAQCRQWCLPLQYFRFLLELFPHLESVGLYDMNAFAYDPDIHLPVSQNRAISLKTFCIWTEPSAFQWSLTELLALFTYLENFRIKLIDKPQYHTGHVHEEQTVANPMSLQKLSIELFGDSSNLQDVALAIDASKLRWLHITRYSASKDAIQRINAFLASHGQTLDTFGLSLAWHMHSATADPIEGTSPNNSCLSVAQADHW